MNIIHLKWFIQKVQGIRIDLQSVKISLSYIKKCVFALMNLSERVNGTAQSSTEVILSLPQTYEQIKMPKKPVFHCI